MRAMKRSSLRLTGIASGTCWILLALAGCGTKQDAAAPAPTAAPAVTSMQSIVLKPGEGAAIATGQMAVVQYTGWLYETAAADNKGKRFDSSLDTGKPFSFPLGAGSVIKGWDQGVVGMQVGERRRLIIPPDMAYGDAGAGGVIPPGATLVFDIELVKIE
jgi:FKBP-type peptidyl-prolyl cis-trans isomerase FkpA